MTVKVFETMDEFVTFIRQRRPLDGEIMCSSYLPSALFPRDSIQEFFTRRQPTAHPKELTVSLWDYGRRLYGQIVSGRCQLLIEKEAVVKFSNEGLVHEAVPDFEVGPSARVHVLRRLRRAAEAGNTALVPGPLPFVFSLLPPDGVLIDVNKNTVDQEVQGLWIQDHAAFAAFMREASRLNLHELTLRGAELLQALDTAIQRIEHGSVTAWMFH